MKRCLICGFAALAFSLNAQAEPKDKDKDKPPKDKDNGAVYSVPDTGSTALLLGSALLVLRVASRRFATR
jgi:protein with PEP-CTERM/exosortase system signal